MKREAETVPISAQKVVMFCETQLKAIALVRTQLDSLSREVNVMRQAALSIIQRNKDASS